MIRGSCLCGDVAWESDGPLELTRHCHCSICRKTHGSAFATVGNVRAGAFRWLRGADACGGFETSPGNVRGFCRRCGSVTPGGPAGGDAVVLALGNLEGDPGARPLAHIYVASRAPWHAIAGALPRFDVLPPGYDAAALPTPERPASRSDCVRGSCQCDGVAWELAAPLPLLRNCHCTRCRKARSAAHASNGFAPLDAFRFLRGEDLLASYKVPEAERFTQVFCTRCGSPMPLPRPPVGAVVIPAGSIDGDPGVRVREHIFVASKAPWYEIADELPQYAEYAPS